MSSAALGDTYSFQTPMASAVTNSLRTGNAALDMVVAMLAVAFITKLLVVAEHYSSLQKLRDMFENSQWLAAGRTRMRAAVQARLPTWLAALLLSGNETVLNFSCTEAVQTFVAYYECGDHSDTPSWMVSALGAFATRHLEATGVVEYDLRVPSSRIDSKSYDRDRNRIPYLSPDGIVYLPQYDMTMTFSETRDNESQTRLVTKNVSLRSSTMTREAMERLVKQLMDDYVDKVNSERVSESRFWSQVVYTSSPNSDILMFSRVRFTTTMCRERLFLRDKDRIFEDALALSDDSVQDKMVLFLHGRPGCGKTALIKTLAKETGRHVVIVRLQDMKSGEDLFAAVHSPEIPLAGRKKNGKQTVDVPLRKRLFVIEEIDVDGSDVVLCRKKYGGGDGGGGNGAMTAANSFLSMLTGVGLGKPPNAPKCPKSPEGPKGPKGPGDGIVNLDDSGPSGPSGPSGLSDLSEDEEGYAATTSKLGTGLKLDTGGLKMADVLSLLDGIVEMPGAIFAITTNHPERIDDAVKRPGRVTHNVELGYLEWPEMMQFLAYWWPGHAFADADLARVKAACPFMSPAAVECMRFEHRRDASPDAFMTHLVGVLDAVCG